MAPAAAGAHADLSYCKRPLRRQDGGMNSHDRLARARALVERAKAAMLHTQRLRADWRARKLERERLLKAVRRTSDEASRKLW
jgi:hypothetical protein